MRGRTLLLAFLLLVLWYSVACAVIARGNSGDGGDNGGSTSSLTVSFDVGSGANRYLVVDTSDSFTTSVITGVTYAGVSMTRAIQNPVSGVRVPSLWTLANPTSGVNNIVITLSGTDYVAVLAAAYTGAIQSTSSPDATATNNTSGTSLATSITTVANNAWAAEAVHTTATGTPTAGTGATLVVSNASFGYPALFDSGGAITPAGSYSMTVNNDTSVVIVAALASFAPSLAAGGGLLLRGVGQ